MAWQFCLGSIEPSLKPEAFSSFAEFDQFALSCLDEVRFDRLAAAVDREGGGSAIRAPRIRRRRRTTKELLDEPIINVAAQALAGGELSIDLVRARLIDLYIRYAAEWASVPVPGGSWFFSSSHGRAA